MGADGGEGGEEGWWWALLCWRERSCSQRVLGAAGTLAVGGQAQGLCVSAAVSSKDACIVMQLMQTDGEGDAGEGNGGIEGG